MACCSTTRSAPARSGCRRTGSTPTATAAGAEPAVRRRRARRADRRLARHPGATFQVIARGAARPAPTRWRGRAGAASAACRSATAWAACTRRRTLTCVPRRRREPFSPRLGFESTIATAAIPPWHEMVNGPAETSSVSSPTRLAGPGPPRLGPPARRAERLPQGAAPHAHPLRLRERHRAGRHLAQDLADRARPPSVGRAGRLGARKRHRVALHEALGAGPQDTQLEMDERVKAAVRRPVRADRRHRRRRAPQHVLRRRRERLRAHALGPRRGAPSASSRPSTA